MGQVHRHTRQQRHDAAVARRSGARRVPQRSPAVRERQRDDPPMGQRRRARRRSEGPAAAAEVCRRLDDRPARRCSRDAGGLSRSRGGDARIQVLRGADELHRGQIHPGRRGSAGHSRRRASRHRLHAIAAAAAAPDRVLVRAGDEQITDTGANQGKARSQRSAGAARARWLARRLRSGSGGSRLPAGNGAARAGGIGADHLDALHGQRQRDDGSDERRAFFSASSWLRPGARWWSSRCRTRTSR